MSTPPFNSTSAEFDDIRFYTEFDPYYYTVDNRPIQDLAGNADVAASAADAGRSGVVIGALAESALNSGAMGHANKVVGLGITNPTTGVVTIAPGVLLTLQGINSGDGREILKKAALPFSANLNTPHPVTLGKEVRHLIQIRHRDFGPGVSYPYYIGDNPFAASTQLNGWLELAVITGNEADTGASVDPTPTAGWTPLYVAKAIAGQTVVTISDASGALPRIRNLVEDVVTSGNYLRTSTGWSAVSTAAQFSSSSSTVASTQFVKRSGVSYSGITEAGVGGSMDNSQVGGILRITSATGVTVVTPPVAPVDDGATVTVLNAGVGSVTLNPAASSTIVDVIGNTVTPVVRQGESIVLTKTGTSWRVTGGTYATSSLPSFAASLTANGYQKLPSGMILQWATAASIAAGGTGSVTLPLAFPTGALFAIANTSASAGSATPSNIVAGTPTTTTVPLYNLGTVAGVAKVIAIGY